MVSYWSSGTQTGRQLFNYAKTSKRKHLIINKHALLGKSLNLNKLLKEVQHKVNHIRNPSLVSRIHILTTCNVVQILVLYFWDRSRLTFEWFRLHKNDFISKDYWLQVRKFTTTLKSKWIHNTSFTLLRFYNWKPVLLLLLFKFTNFVKL
jgi:hypothetical protein